MRICDVCRKELTDDKSAGSLNLSPNHPKLDTIVIKDLCPKCYHTLVDGVCKIIVAERSGLAIDMAKIEFPRTRDRLTECEFLKYLFDIETLDKI